MSYLVEKGFNVKRQVDGTGPFRPTWEATVSIEKENLDDAMAELDSMSQDFINDSALWKQTTREGSGVEVRMFRDKILLHFITPTYPKVGLLAKTP